MKIHVIDIGIMFGYLVLMIITGFWVAKRASKNLDSYFLGGKRLPWWVLGLSDASGMFDISGTMWLVYLLFVYGLKSVWIPWLWPTFNQVFMMVFLSIWLRRSNVLTGAEWIQTRFGLGKGAELSYISVVIFALVSVVGFSAYAFQGIGKFAAVFLPWNLHPNTYATIIMALAACYVIIGGMTSVVITDLLQFFLTVTVSIIIGIIAMMRTSHAQIVAAVPNGWTNIFFGWKVGIDWTGRLDAVNNAIQKDGWSLFTIFFMMMLFKGVLAAAAGPCPNYDMQRVLANKTPKQAALMNWFVSVVLFMPRYMMVAGVTVLALVYYQPDLKAMGSSVDFERILPLVINNFFPVGVMGMVLAGLFAAFMSTFNSTTNAGAAYIVNDIYKRYINPHASQQKYVRMSYACSILVVIVGIGFGFITESINSVLQWIVAGLYGGYIAPNVLKWYWWRFNGQGYFAGMITGIGAALVLPKIMPQVSPLNSFPIILVLSAAASIIVSLLTKPEEKEVLEKFYRQVRPWGFWRPVYEGIRQREPNFERNKNFKRDMVNVVVGTVWQISLVTIPIYIIIRELGAMAISAAVLAATSIFLKKNWFNKLESWPKDIAAEMESKEKENLRVATLH
ncbi:MAG: sodium:solute symporter family protein [Sedimentisphaerales bacterium]